MKAVCAEVKRSQKQVLSLNYQDQRCTSIMKVKVGKQLGQHEYLVHCAITVTCAFKREERKRRGAGEREQNYNDDMALFSQPASPVWV